MRTLVNVFAVMLLSISYAHASNFYTDAGVMVNLVEVGEEDKYYPVTVRAKAGYLIVPAVSLEAHIGAGVYEDKDKDKNLSYKLRNVSGLFLRYGTGAHRHFRAFISAGYSYTTLETDAGAGTIVDHYKGFSYSIGLEENLKTFKDVSFTLEYTNYFDSSDDELTISGLNLGFRAALPF
ncbi:outer membrane beta-barrel protein [Kaarinaea lacus]